MTNITLLTKLSISLIFLSLVSGHPAPECPCKCGSSYGSHPLIYTKQEPVHVQETVVAVPQTPIYYETYSQPRQPVNIEPQSRSYEFTFIPTSIMSQNEPAVMPESFPVSVEMPVPTTFVQSRALETSMPQPQVVVSSSTPCQSDELTGRTLEFLVEPPVISTPSEIKFETYNTGIQEVVQEPVKPVMRALEQTLAPVMMAQPKPTYMIREPAPVHKPVQFITRMSVPEVKEAPVLRSSYTEDLSPGPMSTMFLQPSRASCRCFQQ